MAKTIPGKIDPSWPKGTYRSECAYCSSARMRHELRRNESGHLACVDCRSGRDEVMLSRLNAESAAQVFRSHYRNDGGRDPATRTLPVIHRTTADDITRIIE